MLSHMGGMAPKLTIYEITTANSSTIRVLRLPGKAESFELKLLAASLADPPSYTALSYTWGDSFAKFNVLVNDELLPITQSLYWALRTLQQDHARLLWIDQICIDQSNLKDKATQVPLMEQIYSKAKSTISWLGVATAESERAMDYLREAGTDGISAGLNELPIIADGLMQLQIDIPLQDENFETRFPHLREKMERVVARWGEWQDLDVVPAILALFGNPYFTRGWIKQELAIPKNLTIQYGEKALDIESFKAGFLLFQAHYTYSRRKFDLTFRLNQKEQRNEIRRKFAVVDDSNEIIHPFLKTRESYQSKNRPDELFLERLLRRFGSKVKFSDPRDYIYGFMGLASDNVRLGIPVDYQRSWEQVHTFAMRKIIEGQGIHMLEHNQLPKASDKLPSWVPDFSSKRYWTLTENTISSEQPFRASGDTRQSIVWPTEDPWTDKSLQVRGWVIDTVMKVGLPWDDSYVSRDLPRLFGVLAPCSDIIAFCEESDVLHEQHPDFDIYNQNEQRKEATWKIPILDHEHIATQQRSRRSSSQSAEGYKELEQVLSWGWQTLVERKPIEAIIPLLEEHREQLRMAGVSEHGNEANQLRLSRQLLSQTGQNYYNGMEALQSRRPFLTKKGIVGIGPLPMQQGDVITVFAGSKVPFILRPTSSDPTLNMPYKLIGESYCHGIMDGEVTTLGLPETNLILL
ncbi:heterokaryon incompatibility protein-domain-containing protein [Truncatella angustata]|uniref:Heterokaryon incompatibility protein-domain-containing protein n=1 Tax=Truncatella angustata TaxID=152316 RepID=A0A9P8RM20_9PEZI|nr:heterokaryon incompatibility protein-domain-containing protein [Truncatella angustata]KAH6646738.1 heterokaryon incompatibility protein-domain-containing protein [Truncatella angustata]